MTYSIRTSVYSKISQLCNLAYTELDNLDKYLSVGRKQACSNQKTIFSGKSTKQIVEMITLQNSGNNECTESRRQLITALTDYLLFRQYQDEVVLIPSLYIQYLTLEKLIDAGDYKGSNKRHNQLSKAIRDFLQSLTSGKEDYTVGVERLDAIIKPLIAHLKYLETLGVFRSTANEIAIQKASHLRVAKAAYHHVELGSKHCFDIQASTLALVYKHIEDSSFFACTASLDAQHTIFERCKLDRCVFSYSRFEWTKFIKTTVDHTTFIDSKFFEADFEGMLNSHTAVFVNCRFLLCDLTSSNALFVNCKFDNCQTEGIRIIPKI